MFVHCPYCWQKYEVDEGFQGKETICEKCQKKFKLLDSEKIFLSCKKCLQKIPLNNFRFQQGDDLYECPECHYHYSVEQWIDNTPPRRKLKVVCKECYNELSLQIKVRTRLPSMVPQNTETIDFICPVCDTLMGLEILSVSQTESITKEDLEHEYLRGGTDGAPTKKLPYDTLYNEDFAGKNFVLTGEFKDIKRPALKEFLLKLGAHVDQQITMKTTYLLVGSCATKTWGNGDYGTKIEQALEWKRKGIKTLKIISEENFLSVIKQQYNELKKANTDPEL